VDFDAELLVVLADLRELGGDCVQLGGDGHYAGDSGTEDGEDGSFTGSDGLEGVGGEILHQVGVELEAVCRFRKNLRQKSEGGRGTRGGGRRGGFLETGGVGTGDGSGQGLISWGDGFDLHEGTGRGGIR